MNTPPSAQPARAALASREAAHSTVVSLSAVARQIAPAAAQEPAGVPPGVSPSAAVEALEHHRLPAWMAALPPAGML